MQQVQENQSLTIGKVGRPRTADRNIHGLTIRQQKFCDGIICEGLSPVESAIKSGYSKLSAGVRSREMLRNRYVIEYFDEWRREQERRRQKLADEMYYYKIKKLEEVINNYIEGIKEDAIDVNPNHLKCAMEAIKELNLMQGHYAPVKKEVENKNTNLSVNVEASAINEKINPIYEQYKKEV